MLIEVTPERLERFRAVCKQCEIEYSEDEIRSECSAWLNYFAHLEEFLQKKEREKQSKGRHRDDVLVTINNNPDD